MTTPLTKLNLAGLSSVAAARDAREFSNLRGNARVVTTTTSARGGTGGAGANNVAVAPNSARYSDAGRHSLNSLAIVTMKLGRTEEGLRLKQEAIDMLRRIYKKTPDHEEIASALHNMAISLDNVGRTEDAIRSYEAALVMRRRLSGMVPTLQNEEGDDDGDEQEKTSHKKSSASKVSKRNDSDTAYTMKNLAVLLMREGGDGEDASSRRARGLALLREALDMYKQIHSNNDHRELALWLSAVGEILLSSSAAAGAAASKTKSSATGDDDDDNDNNSERQQQLDEAIKLLQEAVDMFRRLLGCGGNNNNEHEGEDDADLAKTLFNLGSALSMTGRRNEREQALVVLQEALAMLERLLETTAPQDAGTAGEDATEKKKSVADNYHLVVAMRAVAKNLKLQQSKSAGDDDDDDEEKKSRQQEADELLERADAMEKRLKAQQQK